MAAGAVRGRSGIASHHVAGPAAFQGLSPGRSMTFDSKLQAWKAYHARSGADVAGSSTDRKLDEMQFHEWANMTLAYLHDELDAFRLDCVDKLALRDGVLNVTLAEGGTIEINTHHATKEIWYVSPMSGSQSFRPSKNGCWTSPGDALTEVLVDDLTSAVLAKACL